ncbi:MAG: isoprenyl transferase [Paramuribaculum sp.]|nr:isoprenyl transferase [Paramuribaculum sp.]
MSDVTTDILLSQIDLDHTPRHVAIIMDGNGRWAVKRGLDRTAGHVAGVDAVRRVVEAAVAAKVDYLTLYAFSTENWNRPRYEVDALMALIATALERETPGLIENGVRLNMIGDIGRIPAESLESLRRSIEATSGGTALQLNLALSYSSRWEITDAARRIARKVVEGTLAPDEIDDGVVAQELTTTSIPDPDLLIRTGGDLRISNFLLWQIAYSELYFTPVLWPDFGAKEFYEAIIDYHNRERRFGKTSQQIQSSNQS